VNLKKQHLIAGFSALLLVLAAQSNTSAEDLVTVFAPDDTLQCEDFPVPRPIDNDASVLRELGATKICAQAKVPGPYLYAAQCGLPTGQVNAFQLAKSDWETIKKSYVGPLAFKEWPNSAYPKLDPTGECEKSTSEAIEENGKPSLLNGGKEGVPIGGLLGRTLRCYTTGDALTDDYRPERVNIEKDKEGKIVSIWFG